jgi:hypothetical protein
VTRSAHSEEWENVTNSEPQSDALSIVGTIAKYAVGTTAWSSSLALQRRDCIDRRQGFLRIVPVGSGQANGKWCAAAVADQVTLAPALGPVSRIRPGLASTADGPHGAAIDTNPRPINLVVTREPIEQREVHQVPSACGLPVAQAPPARHSRPAAQFARQHLPRDAAAKHKQNAGEARAIRDAWPAEGSVGLNERIEKTLQMPPVAATAGARVTCKGRIGRIVLAPGNPACVAATIERYRRELIGPAGPV